MSPFEPAVNKTVMAGLPSSVKELGLDTTSESLLAPPMVRVCAMAPATDALLKFAAAPLMNFSLANVCVGMLVTNGEGVDRPSKTKMSLLSRFPRVGFQFVPTFQSVLAPTVPPIQV